MPQSGSRKVIGFPVDRPMQKRVNTALSLLRQRPHDPSDDVLVALAIAALEGKDAEELVRLEAALTPKAGA